MPIHQTKCQLKSNSSKPTSTLNSTLGVEYSFVSTLKQNGFNRIEQAHFGLRLTHNLETIGKDPLDIAVD